MKVFSVYGPTMSGKTTTIENIIRELKKRGKKVGSVKNIHFEKFSLDDEGTNTWRHKEAGSEMVVARGPAETDVLVPRQLGMDRVLDFFNQEYDYVVIEGVADTNLPKVLCADNLADLESRLNDLVFVISGCISNQLTEHKGIPVLNALAAVEKLVDLIEERVTDVMPFIYGLEQCRACGSDCRGFVVQTLKKEKAREDCVYVKNVVSVMVGQSEIKVDVLFERKLKGIIEDLAAGLDSYNAEDEIQIRIRKQ
ncbi:MAG: molybdopterin-guanine dinucleotide biosynthesis protein B [Desulfotomaculaceae bacterium]|nr:molybdopterin-guanine dinucleotide biosynthesis protein B [Desulfotomaculaceae bacterium]